jgi:SAM-dependent methyltransferase
MGESFDPTAFKALDAAEDRHFWFVARRRVICAAARRALRGRAVQRILEIGCGNGSVLRALGETFPQAHLFGTDLHIDGLRYAARRVAAPLLAADIFAMPFDDAFDLVGMFDVLEHLEAHDLALQKVRGLLRPGGVLAITVPAHMALWSYMDTQAHHCRRYASRELHEVLTRNGFRVLQLSQFMSALYPLMWLGRRREISKAEDSRAAAEAELRIVPGVNGLLRAALAPEAWLIARGLELPIGTSLLAIARVEP